MTQKTRKVAIVTGASRGIGQAVAIQLADEGFAVVTNHSRDDAAAGTVAAQSEAAGGKAIAIKADVSDPGAVRRLFDGANTAFGRVDVVANNAGIVRIAPIAQMPLFDFDQQIAVNLRGTFLMMAQAAHHLGDGGRFIAVSSSVIAKSMFGYGAYIASKAGVEGLVKVFANELRGRNICVNAVAPGPVATDFFYQGKSDELISQIIGQAPLERIGQPQDIADVVAFLAGPAGGWIDGQVVRANGGFA